MKVKRRILIIVQNLPAPFDRRVAGALGAADAVTVRANSVVGGKGEASGADLGGTSK
jgi:hypothetical protein